MPQRGITNLRSQIADFKCPLWRDQSAFQRLALIRAGLLEGEDEIVCRPELAGVVCNGAVAGCSMGLFSNLATIAGARYFNTVTGKPLVK